MLDSLHIKNFRCFEDLTIPSLGRVNLIVGKNNSGKSTLLEAVALFITCLESKDEEAGWGCDVVDKIRDTLTARGDNIVDGKEASDRELLNNLKYNQDISRISFAITSSSENSETQNEVPDDGELIDENPKVEIYLARNKDKKLFIVVEAMDEKDSMELDKKGYIHRDDERWMTLPESEVIKNKDDLMDYTDSQDKKILHDEILELMMLALRRTKIINVPSGLSSEHDLANIWDEVYRTNKDSEIYDLLKLILPNISSLYFSPQINSNSPVAFVKEKNDQKAKPIQSMGEGVMRLLQLSLSAIMARKGALLIDEFENGLHYSIQEEVWGKLLKLAKELDIWVFATTHSEDTIKAFCKVALADEEVDGKIISLGRSAYGEDKGKITAIVHGEPDDLQYILDTGMEVR